MSDSDSICSYCEEIGDVFISDKTTFWIYSIEYDNWIYIKDYNKKNKTNILTSFDLSNVKKNDIVFIFNKNNRKRKNELQTGFIGIGFVEKKCDKNTELKVFKDENLNKYITNYKFISKFTEEYLLKDLLPYIKKVPTFTTEITFTKKYCNNLLNYVRLDRSIGIAMLKGLYSLYDKTLDKNTEEEENKSETETEESDKVSTESFSEDDNIEDEDDENKNGCIPIMILPCKKFRIPDVKNYNNEKDKKIITEYIKNHYLKCSKCEIVNNNNKEPSHFFDDAEFDYDIADDNDDEIEEDLEYYYALKKYDPYKDHDETYIKFKNIKLDSIYINCLLMLWRTNN